MGPVSVHHTGLTNAAWVEFGNACLGVWIICDVWYSSNAELKGIIVVCSIERDIVCLSSLHLQQ